MRSRLLEKLLRVVYQRTELVSPEASEDAQYSYRNYRNVENLAGSPRTQASPKKEDSVNTSARGAIQLCRS